MNKFQRNPRMSSSQGFDPPQLSVKTTPQAVKNFFQQNFQDHTKFRFFQNYPRYPHVMRYPGSQGAALMLQQQQKQNLHLQQQQLKKQQQCPKQYTAGLQQKHHPQIQQQHQQQQQQCPKQYTAGLQQQHQPQRQQQHKQQQQNSVLSSHRQSLKSSNEEIRNVFSSLDTSDGAERTDIKQEIVDTLVESLDQEPTVPRFNTNKCLSHKLPSLPPLYSKEVLRKTPNLMRQDEILIKKPDKRVLTSLQHYSTKSINNPGSMMTSQRNMMVSNTYMKSNFQGLNSNQTSHQSIPRQSGHLFPGSRLHSLLIEGGNPGAERRSSAIPVSSAASRLSLDRIRGITAHAPPRPLTKKRRRRGDTEPGVKHCHICGEVASSHSYYGAQVRDMVIGQ